MRLHRRPIRSLSGWLTVLVLVTQIAIAAYACPAALAAANAAVAMAEMAEMAEMPGCDGNMPGTMDPDNPQLCRAHCQQGSQAVQPTQATDMPATPVLLAVLDWTSAALLPMQPAGHATLVMSGAPPPGSPPLYLCLLVLRN